MEIDHINEMWWGNWLTDWFEEDDFTIIITITVAQVLDAQLRTYEKNEKPKEWIFALNKNGRHCVHFSTG